MTFPEFVESYTPYKENEILKLDDNILEILEEKYKTFNERSLCKNTTFCQTELKP